jgi:hypothetical protein
MTLSVAALSYYPVKGLRGIDVTEATVEQQGLQGDRRWAVLRMDGVVLTQRDLPAMTRIDAVPERAGLRLECTGFGGVVAVAEGEAVTAVVWRTPVATVAADDAASAWLSRVLGVACRLVHMADPEARLVTPDLARRGDTVSLADGFPLLVVTSASLAAVNDRLAQDMSMARFRPNLVVDGAAAWAEDGWGWVETPGARLRLASACARCKVITLDQRDGTMPVRMEPLRTLGQIRREGDGQVTFGWNAVPERLGVVRVGDTICAEPR